MLCGLLLLGEVCFAGSAAALCCEPPGIVEAAAAALGVSASLLSGALLAGGGAGAKEAAQKLEAALDDLYRRVLAWVLRAANARMFGESAPMGHSIQVMEVPSQPGLIDSAEGFDGLALQRLMEAVCADILTGVGKEQAEKPADQALGPRDFSDRGKELQRRWAAS